MNMLQSGHYAHPVTTVIPEKGFDFGWLAPRNYEPIFDEYTSRPTRPIVDGEARFEDLGIDNDPARLKVKGFWTGYDARNAAYHAVFAGAAGHTYGNHSVWQFYDPARSQPYPPARLDLPWQEAINQPVSGQLHFLKDLMLSRPYFTRIPDQSLIVGYSDEGESHIGATRDRSGNCAMVYLPKGDAVTVDLNKITGPRAVAWWFDPRSGAAARIAGDFASKDPMAFTPPSNGPESDWVLVVDDESQGFEAPGAKLVER